MALFAYSLYIKPAFIRPCFRSPPSLHQVKRASNQVKIGQKQTFICLILSNLGIFGDRKGRNTNIFLKYGAGVGCRVLLWWWLLSCPLVRRCAGVRGFRTCRTCHRLALVLWWCVPCLLSSPLLCLWCIALEYGFISRFKGVFRGFYGADVYLYGFGVLR